MKKLAIIASVVIFASTSTAFAGGWGSGGKNGFGGLLNLSPNIGVGVNGNSIGNNNANIVRSLNVLQGSSLLNRNQTSILSPVTGALGLGILNGGGGGGDGKGGGKGKRR